MIRLTDLLVQRKSAKLHILLRIPDMRHFATFRRRVNIKDPQASPSDVEELALVRNPLKLPPKVPQPIATRHIRIVALDSLYYPALNVDLPYPYTSELQSYQSTTEDEIPSRIQHADIVICTGVRMSKEVLGESVSPRLKMIAVVASGTDHINMDMCKARGIHVANSPTCNPIAVAEHALGFYFSLRRSIVLSNRLVRAGSWVRHGRHTTAILESLRDPDGKAPRTCSEEVVGIIGYGEVGQQIATRAKLLGMQILVSGRKGAPKNAHAARVPFDDVLRNSSVVFVACPRVRDTMRLISHTEFSLMPRHAILINVSRGGIVDERALIMALKARQIAGAATDVFLHEPAGPENSVLLGAGTEDLNLVVTPHSAWFTESTRLNFMACLQKNIVSWVKGKPCNLVV